MIAPLKSAAVHFQLILSPFAAMTRSIRYGRALRDTIVSCLHTQNFTNLVCASMSHYDLLSKRTHYLGTSSHPLDQIATWPICTFYRCLAPFLPLVYRGVFNAPSEMKYHILQVVLPRRIIWGPLLVLCTNGLTGLYSRQRCMRWYVAF